MRQKGINVFRRVGIARQDVQPAPAESQFLEMLIDAGKTAHDKPTKELHFKYWSSFYI